MMNNIIFRYSLLVISVITVSAATMFVSCSGNKSTDKKQPVSVGVYTVNGATDANMWGALLSVRAHRSALRCLAT